MHMADALLSPAVGLSLMVVSGAGLAWSARRIKTDERDDLVPLMGVLGAFVFAAQMINFTIPGTGSSGHIGGGLLLAILLGPQAAFVVMASVLTVQALFFADGGLLALGANIFNLGVCTCFVAYPLIYQPLTQSTSATPSSKRVGLAAVLSAVMGLQLGSLGVVTETQLSGISSLPLNTFLWLMQPIHLAIGLVEGVATAALVLFVRQARPDLFARAPLQSKKMTKPSVFPTRLIAGLGGLALLCAGVFSWFASAQPDGLEWSIARTTGHTELQTTQSALHGKLAAVQKQLGLLVGYKFPLNAKPVSSEVAPTGPVVPEETWPAVDPATSLAGVIGGGVTLALVLCLGYLFRRRTIRALPADRREN